MTVISSERVQAGIWIGVGIALLALMYLLTPVLTPFALAAALAYVLLPGTDWLTRHRLPRSAACLLVMLMSSLLILGMLLILVPVLRREIGALQDQLPAVVGKLNEAVAPRLSGWLGTTISFDAQTLRDLLAEQAGAQSDLIAKLIDRIRAGGAAIIGVVGLLVLVPVVLFYLLLDWHHFMRTVQNALPRRWHDQVVSMFTDIDRLLSQFLRGQLLVMLILAAYYSIALAIAGFEAALPIGLLTGLLVFIPYVGYSLGLLLALLIALLQFGNAYGLIAVGVIYGFGQVLESFFLTPRLVGERIGLHPLAVIFALLAFGQVFGFFGVLVALPASAALLVALGRVKKAYMASDFYRHTP